MLVKPVKLRQYSAFESQCCFEAWTLEVLLSTFKLLLQVGWTFCPLLNISLLFLKVLFYLQKHCSVTLCASQWSAAPSACSTADPWDGSGRTSTVGFSTCLAMPGPVWYLQPGYCSLTRTVLPSKKKFKVAARELI